MVNTQNMQSKNGNWISNVPLSGQKVIVCGNVSEHEPFMLNQCLEMSVNIGLLRLLSEHDMPLYHVHSVEQY